MLDTKLYEIETQLKEAIGAQIIRDLGKSSGFVIREREITADRFVPSLLKSLGSHSVESIADLVPDFNCDHDLTIHYKPFYQRLNTPCFPRLMRGVLESMLTHLYVDVLRPLRNGPFARFRDILFQDGTSFALHDNLATAFKGRFTKVSPAAVELHCTMSLFSDTLVAVTMTGDAECERHELPDPKDLRGILIMGDRKRYRALEGRRLSHVLKKVAKDKALDMDVCWKGPTRAASFRVAVRWNPVDKEWVRLITNLDRDEFTTEDLFQAYRLRWQIELLFKELKSYANLHKFSTTKEPIAEGLIWASLCAAILKRFLAHACQQVVRGSSISTRRVSMCGHHILSDICGSLVRGAR
jgi:hypothetical protein